MKRKIYAFIIIIAILITAIYVTNYTGKLEIIDFSYEDIREITLYIGETDQALITDSEDIKKLYDEICEMDIMGMYPLTEIFTNHTCPVCGSYTVRYTLSDGRYSFFSYIAMHDENGLAVISPNKTGKLPPITVSYDFHDLFMEIYEKNIS